MLMYEQGRVVELHISLDSYLVRVFLYVLKPYSSILKGVSIVRCSWEQRTDVLPFAIRKDLKQEDWAFLS